MCWELVARCLRPDGRVLFVDDAYRGAEELVEGAASTTIQRRLRDGTPHRAVKVPHTVDVLQRTVHGTRGPFYCGAGGAAAGVR